MLYADYLPRLQARESLNAIGLIAVGSGAAEENDAKRIRRTLMMQAREPRRQVKRIDGKNREAILATMGIKVKHV